MIGHTKRLVFVLSVIIVWIAVSAAAEEHLRVLVVTGGHGYQTSFYSVFEGYDDWVWTHQIAPVKDVSVRGLGAYRSDMRKQHDVLVLYDMAREDIGEKARQHLRDFVESGKGVVVLHHAIANQGYGDWWYKEVVGGLYLVQEMMGRPKSTFKHDIEMVVRPTKSHPVTRGLGTLHITDEGYKGMWVSPQVEVLMETENPHSDRQVVWVSPYEKSRVVVVELGHDEKAHRHVGYRRLVRQAILWSAGRLK